jgi:hypothetical protein
MLTRRFKERQTSCRIFQLFASPLATSGGTPRFLQPGTCCCANNFCVIINGGVTAQATLNANMGATFDLNANGATGRGSIDFNGFAWTVAGRGGAKRYSPRNCKDGMKTRNYCTS